MPPATDAPPLLPPQAPSTHETNVSAAENHGFGDGQVLASDTTQSAGTTLATDGNRFPTAAGAPPTAPVEANGAKTDPEQTRAQHVASILDELTSSVGINAELQCTLCHEVLCKPITTPCGHSFCRVCLVEYLLSKDVDETQCPICRGLVLHAGAEDQAAPAFNVNVTLWNLIQLLIPLTKDKDSAEEEADYALKYDQFDAKWRIAALHQSAANGGRRRRRHNVDDEIPSSEDEMEGAHEEEGSDDGHDTTDAGQRRRQRYPELREENTVDGHLQIFRNVVLDRDDANEDGYEGMRVSLAVMEFPSLFTPFNEHQECSIVVLKCEEDEDMDSGIPFFTSDDGDDDALIISDYYNEIRLRVTDNVGNVVMERIRGSTQGIATFPNLRLDVPAGMYNFQFKDDLYGLRLTIRTEVRDLRDEDASSDIGDGRAVRLVLDQAGERSRSSGRHRQLHEDDDDESESGSDDSFIVNDDEELDEGHHHEAHFSGGDDSDSAWPEENEDDEEEILERHERSLLDQRRQRHAHQTFNSESSEGEHSHVDGDEDQDESYHGGRYESDDDDEDHPSSVSSGRSVKRTRIVDDDSDSENDGGEDHVQSALPNPCTRLDGDVIGRRSGRKRSRAIMGSEDENDLGDVDEETKSDRDVDVPNSGVVSGFSSNKRLRHIATRMFRDDDNDAESDREDGTLHPDRLSEESGEEDSRSDHQRARWIRNDPYWPSRGEETVEALDNRDNGDTRYDSESSHSDQEEEPWNSGYGMEHEGDSHGEYE